MFERRRARILLATLMLVSLVLLTIDERAGAGGALGRVRTGVATVFEPVQDGVATIVRPIGAVLNGVVDLFRLWEENARLKAELEQMRGRRESLEDVTRENESLRALLDMREELSARSGEYRFLPAEVIALAPSNFEWTITLNVGASHGIREGMTVITGKGLVGRIIQVGPISSRGLLAIDRGFSVAVRLARSGEHGILQGGGTDPMQLNLINPEADVAKDDEIVTSTYSNAMFPDGIPVGAVGWVGEKTGLLTREVLVRPYVDFAKLDVVLVILRAPPPAPLPPVRPGPGVAPATGATPGGQPASEAPVGTVPVR
ncbi:MAG: rod shape-determining protein MreC [Actinomycetota bacterium]|nr:rod shape-determining protein MreC [Actinomycetota bacterium]